jgi:hypothetical protein
MTCDISFKFVKRKTHLACKTAGIDMIEVDCKESTLGYFFCTDNAAVSKEVNRERSFKIVQTTIKWNPIHTFSSVFDPA